MAAMLRAPAPEAEPDDGQGAEDQAPEEGDDRDEREGEGGVGGLVGGREQPLRARGGVRRGRLLLLRAGQRLGEVRRRGLRLAEDLDLELDGELGRDLRGEGRGVGRVERDVPLPRRGELVLVVVAGQDLLEAQDARPGRRARLPARGGRALQARRGRVVGPAALFAELLAQRAEDVQEVGEVREALVEAVGQRIGLDLRRVDRGLDPQHLALGEAHLPVDRLARGHRVVVGAGPSSGAVLNEPPPTTGLAAPPWATAGAGRARVTTRIASARLTTPSCAAAPRRRRSRVRPGRRRRGRAGPSRAARWARPRRRAWGRWGPWAAGPSSDPGRRRGGRGPRRRARPDRADRRWR